MKWFLTQQAINGPQILVRDDEDDPAAGYSLMRILAEEPGSQLEEIAPGMWMASKIAPQL